MVECHVVLGQPYGFILQPDIDFGIAVDGLVENSEFPNYS